MLRLETKNISKTQITGQLNDVTLFPKYGNVIRETLSHFPTGHYVSLVSAYAPLKYNDVGQFNIKNNDIPIIANDVSQPIKSIDDLLSRFVTNISKVEPVPDGRLKFTVVDLQNQNNPNAFTLNLSATAAWFLGFHRKTNHFTAANDPGVYVLFSDEQYPLATIRYLQVICRNVCGTNDSNMTMPTCLGIMHVTDNLTLINPHIAVNHRINEGRVIDIEILDQDNHPFQWTPVYLELFVSEKAEHEKKQGFFRLEKSGLVHLHAPVKLISVPDLFATETPFTIKLQTAGYVSLTIGTKTIFYHPDRQFFCQQFAGTVLTRTAVTQIFNHINDFFTIQLKPYLGNQPINHKLLSANIENNNVRLEVLIGTLHMTDFLNLFNVLGEDPHKVYIVHMDHAQSFPVDPDKWYNEDSRIYLYCAEFHDRYPVVVARRLGGYYQIINRAFWTWHELEKDNNELHFRAERVITYPDGSIFRGPWPTNKELLFQLFYK